MHLVIILKVFLLLVLLISRKQLSTQEKEEDDKIKIHSVRIPDFCVKCRNGERVYIHYMVSLMEYKFINIETKLHIFCFIYIVLFEQIFFLSSFHHRNCNVKFISDLSLYLFNKLFN